MERDKPKFIHVEFPIIPGWFGNTLRVWMERNVDGNTPIERDGCKVLVEVGFEEDNLVPGIGRASCRERV